MLIDIASMFMNNMGWCIGFTFILQDFVVKSINKGAKSRGKGAKSNDKMILLHDLLIL